MDWPALLTTLLDGDDLTPAQSADALRSILSGEATEAQIAALLIGLRSKGETIAEVSAMVDVMLETAAPVVLPPGPEAIDIVGTGGSPHRRVHALNVSTMSCFVAAGAGARVVKHGNRRASSTSGSFDLLEVLGVPLELDGEGIARCVEHAGIAFCFARSFHPAMRHAGPVRSQLGVPTVFNFLGPLSNPAGVTRQVIGVSDRRLAPLVAGVLASRGAARAIVVTGDDGMDEITTTGPSSMFEVRDGVVREWAFDPRDLGIPVVEPSAIAGGGPEANAAIARRVLAGEQGSYRDIVCCNAAAGIVVAGLADDLSSGLRLAQQSIDSGAASAVLERLLEVS